MLRGRGLPPSPPAEKASACQDQTGETRTDQSKAMEPHNERDDAGAMSGQALSGRGNGHRRPTT